ncbi:hypothetical protein ABC383_07235 [Noviherbaspirillum sp. 1P10PC]|uniref:hypothetical protein n=1 Tax=Noviherbaspirillum sp. 1P10PC TaxID=3132292 RepID=UPI0039A29517
MYNNPVLNLNNPPPGGAGQFDLVQLPAAVGLLQSILGVNVYSEINVPKAHMIFDAVTAGYGTIAAVQMLPLANLAQVYAICTYAQSRAPLLQSIYGFPNGAAAGPVVSPAQSEIETTEKVHLSFVLGQTVAMCMARQAWGVQRLFHRSLYGPLLPILSPGMAALAPGLSPDFLCFSPLPNATGVGLCFVESKGTHRKINQHTRINDRDLINDAFENQIAPAHNALPGGAYMCAVSLACRDEAQPNNRVVGQFWDPVNEDAIPANVEAVHRLTAQYFMAMRAFLLSIGLPKISRGGRRVAWDARLMRMHIEMAAWQWRLMEELAARRVSEKQFFYRIEKLDKRYWIHFEDGHNGDGLYLTMNE